jgi:threonine synthase
MIIGASVNDADTRQTIKAVHRERGYFLDPHGAVGWRAADQLAEAGVLEAGPLAVLATAHPAKFAETVEPLAGPPPVPPSLRQVMERKVTSRTIPADIAVLKDVL